MYYQYTYTIEYLFSNETGTVSLNHSVLDSFEMSTLGSIANCSCVIEVHVLRFIADFLHKSMHIHYNKRSLGLCLHCTY